MVVSVQYRLNAFGFLSTGDDIAKGNYGLYDQLEALRFIHKHIHAFGGNPRNVTIFGNSAGGTSVGYHVMSPMSNNLYKSAISMSGSAPSPTLGDKAKSKNLTVELARLLNCTKPNIKVFHILFFMPLTSSFTSNSVECFSSISLFFNLFLLKLFFS